MQQNTEQLTKARNELQEQIRQTVEDAVRAAREGAEAGQGAGRGVVVVPPLPPGYGNNDMPPGMEAIAISFFVTCAVMVVGWPIARALSKRIERRGDVGAVTPQMADQLRRIEQAVEAISVEVERISESQRYMAKLQKPQAAEAIATQSERR